MDAKKRFGELALRALYTDSPQFTPFLEPSAENDVRAAAHGAGVQACFFGGCENAERRMAAFYGTVPPDPCAFPLCCLQIRWNAKFSRVEHRDLLGALMGLGLERDTTGDIFPGVEPGTAYLFCSEDIADYICASMDSAGRAAVKIRRCEDPRLAPVPGTDMRVTVQNLRLDAVLAAGCRLSRSEAQKLISQGLVKLDHLPEVHADARLEEGSLISARGFGRLRVAEIQGENRKGRIGVLLTRYGK